MKRRLKNYLKKYIYNQFLDYFNSQGVDYFKNKTLCLENINIKFITTNSLENFNRVFKSEFNQKGEIENSECVKNQHPPASPSPECPRNNVR